MKAPSALFLLYLFRTFFYEMFPEATQALVWNVGGSISIMVLLLMSAWRLRSYSMVAIATLWAYEEILVIFGSLLRITNPEIQPEYYETLTHALRFPFGVLSISLCAGVATLIYKEDKCSKIKHR